MMKSIGRRPILFELAVSWIRELLPVETLSTLWLFHLGSAFCTAASLVYDYRPGITALFATADVHRGGSDAES